MNLVQVCLAAGAVLTVNQADARPATSAYPDMMRWGSLPGSISWEEIYDGELRQLGELAIDKSSDHDVIRFVVEKSFDTLLAITVRKSNWLDSTENGLEWVSDITLTVTYIDYPERVEEIPGGNHFSRTVERYFVGISETEFESTANAMFDGGFFHDPNFIPTKRLCTDATVYFIEAKVGRQYNLIDRDFCAGRFREDFPDAQILLDFARKKLPMLNAKFDTIEKSIRGSQRR